MNINVLLFGSLVDIVGKSSLTISDTSFESTFGQPSQPWLRNKARKSNGVAAKPVKIG